MVLFSPFRAKNTPEQPSRLVNQDHSFGKLSNVVHFYLILLMAQK